MGLESGGTGVEVGSGLGAEEEVWGSILGGVVGIGDGGEEECRVGGGRLVGSDLGGGIGERWCLLSLVLWVSQRFRYAVHI